MQEFSRMLREYEERWGDLEELADHVDELDLDDSEEAQGFRAALMDVRADRARLRRAIEALAEDFAEPVTQRVERRTTTD